MEVAENSVLTVYKTMICDVIKFRYGTYTGELSHEYDKMNIPICAYQMDYGINQYIKFCTLRRNKVVQIDIQLQKFEPRFYEDEGSDEYCLSINIHEELVNLEKFQQEFSIFLVSEKSLIDFITGTVWPHIDAAVKKNDCSTPFHGAQTQKSNEETDREEHVSTSREDRYRKRCLRMSD